MLLARKVYIAHRRAESLESALPYQNLRKKASHFSGGEVKNNADGDVIEIANQLEDSGLVEFAEPELIEEINPRS
jgi:hypothetical protein